MSQVYAVVMAGGRGERFWPLSTDRLPKPFVPLLGPRTLIQETVDRLEPLIPPGRILISIGENHGKVAAGQLPQIPPENFIVEPEGRDTAASLGFCALHLERRDPESTMIALPSDHHVSDPVAYRGTLQQGIERLAGATAVVFGIKPVRPDTGYGYIQAKPPAGRKEAWPVLRFVEKPDSETAARYVESGDYFWNSGIFLWRNRTLLALLQRHLPETSRRLDAIRPLLDRRDARPEMRRIFASLDRISIDYGVLEKTSGLRLVPAAFGWDDVGNWAALARILGPDRNGTVSLGPHTAVQARDCVIYSDAGPVAVFGVSDLVVVQAHGKVLVCPTDQAAGLKRLVAALGPEND